VGERASGFRAVQGKVRMGLMSPDDLAAEAASFLGPDCFEVIHRMYVDRFAKP
jgi:hypothetical protein